MLLAENINQNSLKNNASSMVLGDNSQPLIYTK